MVDCIASFLNGLLFQVLGCAVSPAEDAEVFFKGVCGFDSGIAVGGCL